MPKAKAKPTKDKRKNKRAKAKSSVAKPTNPKDAIGIKKVPMSCLSSHSVALIAEAMVAEGLDGPDQMIVASTSFNAAIANLMMFWEGVGDDDRIPKLARSMAHTVALRDAELEGRLVDDRTRGEGLHVKDLNEFAEQIIKKLPDCLDPYIQLPAGSIGFKVPVTIDKDTPFHVMPWRIILEIALGMMEGGRKYGRHNYRAVGVRATVYYDATTRHLGDFIEGTNVDRDSGLSHLTKALSSSQVLLDCMVMGNWIDDRPLRVPDCIQSE